MNKLSLGFGLLVGLSVLVTGCGDSSSGSAGSGGSAGAGGEGGGGGNGCPTGEVPCDGVCIDEIAPTLAAIQTDVFEVSCTASSCHDSDNSAAMLDLSTLSASEANLIDADSVQVDGKRVVAGDTDASYLMNKLLGVDIAEGTTRMPQLDTDGLCAPKFDAIEQWIEDGAPIQ